MKKVRLFKVFVYGTLKKGFSNHAYLEDSIFLGEAITVEKYVMYVDTIPFVSKSESISEIHGEVYLITKNILKKIDRLEQNNQWYIREEVKVKLKQTGEIIKAWLYFNEYEKGKIEPSGFFNKC